jgi:hypothetical protein
MESEGGREREGEGGRGREREGEGGGSKGIVCVLECVRMHCQLLLGLGCKFLKKNIKT